MSFLSVLGCDCVAAAMVVTIAKKAEGAATHKSRAAIPEAVEQALSTEEMLPWDSQILGE